MSALALGLAALVGLALGLLGGGGGILAVPILVYVVKMPPAAAVPVSLAAVGATSLVAALLHAREGRLDLRAAILFGGAGAVGAACGAVVTARLPPAPLLLAFGVVMLVAGARMIRPRGNAGPVPPRPARSGAMAGAGLGVGVLSGLFGIGGGFLTVPALVLLAGLPMHRAVGTSLLVIALNASGGLLSHAAHGSFPAREALLFTGATVAGALVGTRLSGQVPPGRLQFGFGLFVLLTGAAVAIRNALLLVEAAG